MKKIFIVEDDVVIKRELTIFLQKYGFNCITTEDYKNIIEIIIEEKSDLILLDINLPYFDGYYICKELRKKTEIPIVILTAQDTEKDELRGLELGADDFISKPYSTKVLLARMEKLLKRKGESILNLIEYKGIKIYLDKNIVEYKDKRIELSKNEFRILTLLIHNNGLIVTKERVMKELWQSSEFIDENTLRVNINRLRKKLESIGLQEFLITRRGEGYIV